MAANKDDAEAAAVFKALADSTRRRVLEDLSKGELGAGELASRFPISGPSVSRHLAVLKAAGLVTERRSANRVLYSLVGDRLATHVGEFLAIVCPERAPAPRQGKKKTKAAQKSPGRGKHKAPAAITGPRPPTEAPAHRDGTAPGPVSATV
jgi:DNA-binding transcriptional ArsR family regulator